MAIREARSRHARTTPQGYPPPEAYGPVWPFVPQQAGPPTPPGTPVPSQYAPGHSTPGPYAPGSYTAGWYAPGQHAATPTNPLATSGFVVGLVGLVLSLVPVIGLLGWVLCPVGLGLSVAGLVQVDRRAGAGRGLSVAGVVLGAIGLVVCLLWVVALTR